MSHCDEYLELISAAIDGALSPAELEKLHAHLAQCPGCKTLYEELSALHAALEDLPPVEVPSDLTERIMAAVAAEQVLPFSPAERKKPSIRWQRWLASAAVLAVVLMGTWSWKPWERKAPQGITQDAGSQEISAAGAASAALMEDAEAAPEAAPDSTGILSGGAGPQAKTAQAGDSDQVLPEEPEPFEEAASDTPAVPREANPAQIPQAAPVPPQAAEPLPEMETGGDNGMDSSAQAPALFSNSVPDLIQAPPESEPSPELPQETLEPMVRSFFMPTGAPASVTAEKSEPLTAQEAFALLLEEMPMPDGAEVICSEDQPGWQTPLTSVEGDGQQVSTRLEYLGLTANGKYHEFWLHNFLVDDPETGLAHSSTLNFFAVGLDGGTVLTQRQDPEEGLSEEAALEAYEAGIQAYLQATTE